MTDSKPWEQKSSALVANEPKPAEVKPEPKADAKPKPKAKPKAAAKAKSTVSHGVVGVSDSETVTPTIARAPEDPQLEAEKPVKEPKAKAEMPPKLETAEGEATKDHAAKHEILMVFRGGERDGVTRMVDADTESIVEVTGHNPHEERYNICDEQEGDARVFRFTTGDSEALSTGVLIGPDVGTTLQQDLDALEAETKKSGNEKKRV